MTVAGDPAQPAPLRVFFDSNALIHHVYTLPLRDLFGTALVRLTTNDYYRLLMALGILRLPPEDDE